jgi:hypothetical protein
VFTRAEAVTAAIVAFLASAMVAAYVGDTVGVPLHPLAILMLSVVGAAAMTITLRRSSARDRGDLIAFVTIVAGVACLLLWLAWPSLLPIGAGPDLTHHLLLVDHIERTGRLVHDRALGAYLGEMIDYTPGLHLLAVAAGRWTGRDAVHAIFPIVVLSAAMKAGVVFLIALRCLASARPERAERTAFALAAVLMLAFPHVYVLGSFIHDSYFPQVVSEFFALVMWLAILVWDESPSADGAVVFAVAGVAAFLTWPVWIGPPIATLAVVARLRRDVPPATRAVHVAIATAPIAAVAGVYACGRMGASAIAAAGGAVPWPTPATVGWLLLTIGSAGALIALADRRARSIPVLLASILVQAGALAVVAKVGRASAPYLALKMAYLAMYPLAVGAAYLFCIVARPARSLALLPKDRAQVVQVTARPRRVVWWLVPIVVLVFVVHSMRAMPRSAPAVVTDPLNDAGRWARTHLPPSCVDYLVDDGDGAYWLHLAVLGNARASARSTSSDTYDPQKARERWILPGGLPYAIVENLEALPKDIRDSVDVLARFGSAAVVKRRGRVTCEGQHF